MNFLLNVMLTVLGLPWAIFNFSEYKRMLKVIWASKAESKKRKTKLNGLEFVIVGLIGAICFLLMLGRHGNVETESAIASVKNEVTVADKKTTLEQGPEVTDTETQVTTDDIQKPATVAPTVVVEDTGEDVIVLSKHDKNQRHKSYMLTASSIAMCKAIIYENPSLFPTKKGFCEHSWKQAQVFADGSENWRKNKPKLLTMAGMTIVNYSDSESLAVPFYMDKHMTELSYRGVDTSLKMGVKRSHKSFSSALEVSQYFNEPSWY